MCFPVSLHFCASFLFPLAFLLITIITLLLFNPSSFLHHNTLYFISFFFSFFFFYSVFFIFPYLGHSTRESLASNTSSNVDNNRRQNMALSPRHMGGKRPPPPYHVPAFRPIPEPPATRPEKQASITSV